MRISRDPLLEDPYEQDTVYVAQSGIATDAGEGLFAKRNLRKGELVALFSGLREVKHGRSVTITAGDEAWSDYRLTLGMKNSKKPETKSRQVSLHMLGDEQSTTPLSRRMSHFLSGRLLLACVTAHTK